jgi:hypothetical protein
MLLVLTGEEGHIYHYYSELKEDAMYTSTCLLGLRYCVEALNSHNWLKLIFANFTDLKSLPADSGFVKPDNYHSPMRVRVIFVCRMLIIV